MKTTENQTSQPPLKQPPSERKGYTNLTSNLSTSSLGLISFGIVTDIHFRSEDA